jgi:hypothetical protein
LPNTPGIYFAYAITAHGGRNILVHRDAQYDQYLQFQGTVGISQDDQTLLRRLGPQETAEVVVDILIETSRAGISFTPAGNAEVPTELLVTKSVPLDLLTEAGFTQTIDQTNMGEALVRGVFDKRIREIRSKRSPR